MNDDKRSTEALSLRAFFDEQMQHLHTLFDSLTLAHEPKPRDEDGLILESFVDAANSRMRAVSGYAEKLREHVRALHGHALGIYAQIPPPREVSGLAFKFDPLVNSLFVNVDDIERLFSSGTVLKSYLATHGKYQVPLLYALLTAGKSEKSIFGIGMQGDLLVREVAQKSVNFSGHKIHLPSASEAELNSALKQYLFERIVALVKQEMASRVAAEASRPADKSYQAKLKSLANPEVYLNSLIEYLAPVGDFLRLERTHFRLNKLGVKLDEHDGQCANEFDIEELIWRDNSRYLVLKVAYAR